MVNQPLDPNQKEKKNKLKAVLWFLLDKKNLPLVASLLGGAAVVTTSTILLANPRSSSSQPSSQSSSAPSSSITPSSSSTPSSTPSSSSSSSSSLSTSTSSSSSETVVRFDVTFDTLGGTEVSTLSVVSGELVTEPSSTFGAMTLEGWYTSTDNGTTLDVQWNFATDVVNADLTLYANWEDPELNQLQTLDVADGFIMYIDSFNVVWGWGSNFGYKLGNGSEQDRIIPTRSDFSMLEPDEEIIHVSAENDHSVALSNLGHIYTFGEAFDNTKIQLPTRLPLTLLPGESVANVYAGNSHTFVLTTLGRLFGMGENYDGEIGFPHDGNNLISTLTEIPFADFIDGERVVEFSHQGGASFAISNMGKLYAWGWNEEGRLGNGELENNPRLPEEITLPNLLEGEFPIDVQIFRDTAVALTNQHRVYGWGNQEDGQLATGTFREDPFLTPTLLDLSFLQPNEKIILADAGADHTAFLTDLGTVYQVGDNSDKQLGTGNSTDVNRPIVLDLSHVLVDGEEITFLDAADDITIMKTNTNRLLGIGDNPNNIITTETSEDVLIAREIIFHGLANDEGFSQVAVGEQHTLALTSTNRLLAWGHNSLGELGLPTIEGTFVPLEVTLPLNENETIDGIYVKSYSSFALTSSGRLFGWGQNASGELGDGGTLDYFTPTELNYSVLGLGESIVSFFPGQFSSFFITNQNRVFGFGNWFGIGDGTTDPQPTPILITFAGLEVGETITTLYGISPQRYAITSLGRVYGWGNNDFSYQLGLDDLNDRLSPTLLTFAGLQIGENIIHLAVGASTALALTNQGRVYGWGFNRNGELGNFGTEDVRVPTIITFGSIPAEETIIRMVGNNQNSFFIFTDNNKLYVFGNNSNYQLGTGNNSTLANPSELSISGLRTGETIADVSLTMYSTFAITTEGRLFSWGMNSIGGKLGHYDEREELSPRSILF